VVDSICPWVRSMTFTRIFSRGGFAFALSLIALAPRGVGAAVVVDDVEPGGMGHAVGLQAGRVFDAWQLLDADGEVLDEGALDDPFDFVAVQYEVAPRGPIRLDGPQGPIDLRWEEWGIDVAPQDPDSDLDRAWKLAVDAESATEVAAQDSLFLLAIEAAATSDVARAELHRRWGDRAQRRPDYEAARMHYETALELDTARVPDGLAVARDHMCLAALAGRRSDHRAADDHFTRASEILREEARPGPMLAEVLAGSAFVTSVLGDMDSSEVLLDEAAALVEATGLQGRVALMVLSNRGSLTLRRGDHGSAVTYFETLIEISDALGRRDRVYGTAWYNRAVCHRRMGDLEAAERFLMRALEVRRELAPESLEVAQTYQVLGNIQGDRGDHERALEQYERAAAMYERLAPDSFALAVCMINLGAGYAWVERFDETERCYTRAVDILGRVASGSYVHTIALRNLSSLMRNQERWDEAEALTLEVLEATRRTAPGSLDEANLLDMLAHDAYRRDDVPRATELFDQAFALRARSAPGARATAASAYWGGRMRAESGDLADAMRCYCDAVDVLEVQRRQYGGTEGQNIDFGREYELYAARCLESLVELGEADEAFTVLERTRARFLLSLFAGREGLLEGELPESIEERRRAHREQVDATLAALGRLGDDSEERAEELRSELATLEIERQEIAAAMRREAPRLDALEAYDTLDAEEIVDVLDPGTVYVAYWLGPEVSTAFVVPAGSGEREVETHVFEVGTDALEDGVTRMREAIVDGAPRAEVDAVASELYASLFAPWEDRLEGAERLLISADGPLRVLPFAALRDGEGRYLVERLPLHLVDSITLYARLREGREDFDPGSARVVAFGDPVYGASSEADEDDASAVPIVALRDRGFDFEPLPGTGREIEVLESLFPASIEVYTGDEATEDRVKSLGSDVDILHFACHAVADREIPSASTLVLSLPEDPGLASENGLLQAWEILEQVRVDAQLVTLSACETAIGKQLGPEGMAGLTRAFQYAGARSIVASLWNVPDEPTAALMRVFYTELAEGVTKDEALRRAQLALLNGTSVGGPSRAMGGLVPSDQEPIRDAGFAWAAMQLIGDWR